MPRTTVADGDVELVERARHDREAFGELYQRYYPVVARYVHRRTGNGAATEEIVSDVFHTVLTRLVRFRWRRVPFRNWVLRIATNAVRRWERTNRRRGELHRRSARPELVEDEGSTPEDDGEVCVQAALRALPLRFQEVLVLHHVEGLRVDAVAEVVGCRVGTVKSRLARGRAALRERLEAKHETRRRPR